MSEYESYLSELSDRIQPFKRGNLFLTFVMRIQKLWNSFGSRCLFGADSVCRFGVLSAWSGMSRCLARLPTCPYVRVRTGHVRSTAPSHNGNEHRFGIIITFVMSDQNCTCPRTSRISRNVSNWMRCKCHSRESRRTAELKLGNQCKSGPLHPNVLDWSASKCAQSASVSIQFWVRNFWCKGKLGSHSL